MSQIGGALAVPTRILLGVHHLIVDYWWLGILLVLGAFVGLRAFVRSDEGRMTLGPLSPADTRLRSHWPPPVLRTVFANARDPDGKRNSPAQRA